MSDAKEALRFLETEIGKRETRVVLNFEEYSALIRREPNRVLRSIFQLFYDMVKSYVGDGVDEYPNDPESVGFIKYDCSKLLAEGADNPFFADRLFANRFIRQVESLRQGFQQNRMYVYDGPSGCGKSTFLNNLLHTFEAYTNTKEGQIFEMFWEIDEGLFLKDVENPRKLTISCPSHDYPILVIPKDYREGFLNKLWPDGIPQILKEKDYEWLFKEEVCTICKSIFESSLEKLGSIGKVLDMVRARVYKFDRRVGEGISIFNPGDKFVWGAPGAMSSGNHLFFTDQKTQEDLALIFGANAVKYVFSPLAKTNNGIYVLMDIKLHNEERLRELHNVISEGVHKVDGIEERINSFFLALMNPEDKKTLDSMESLKGRIKSNKIPFVLESAAEVNIYRSVLGQQVDKYFLPGVLGNFAKVIIASRMNKDSQPLKEWIPNFKEYEKYCDANGLLLRMSIFGGIIPDWLSDNDRKKFIATVRQALISDGENEGDHGFSGRISIDLFKEFFSRYGRKQNLICMDNVLDFFKYRISKDRRDEFLPKNFLIPFLTSLVDSYDYTVLNEVKDALFVHNKEQIKIDILNYLCAINYDPGSKIKCKDTNQELEVTLEFLKLMASRLGGEEITSGDALKFARDIQKKYVTIVARGGINITETELYRDLFSDYVRNLTDNVLRPFVGNENFREAIKSFGKEEFDTFDTRLKEHVIQMIKNLINKFGYTEQGAKEICLYVLDKKLVEKFLE